jgi:hypothetical protein
MYSTLDSDPVVLGVQRVRPRALHIGFTRPILVSFMSTWY